MKRQYRFWLHLEGLLAFLVSLRLFDYLQGSWWLYAGAFLLFDASMLGYVRSKAMGALTYNFAHSYVLPAIILLVTGLETQNIYAQIAAVWVGHIGIDRAFGFGLKSVNGFKHTHLGDINVKT